jgi:hypothetical protein
MVEVLYVGELVGLTLIWLGYRSMTGDPSPSIHRAQVDESPSHDLPARA